MKSRSTAKLTATELDALHESGGDMRPHMDLSRARRPGRETQRINVDFPIDFLARIDTEADRIGVARQSWIKTILAQELKHSG
jgi:hypothetical protein